MNESNYELRFLAINKKKRRCRRALQAAIFCWLALSCANANSVDFPDVESILCVPPPKPPISTNSDAICFAAHVDGVADSLRSAQKQAKYDGWISEARRSQEFNGWEVTLRSTGKILPSYVCKLFFTENGRLVNVAPICGYTK